MQQQRYIHPQLCKLPWKPILNIWKDHATSSQLLSWWILRWGESQQPDYLDIKYAVSRLRVFVELCPMHLDGAICMYLWALWNRLLDLSTAPKK